MPPIPEQHTAVPLPSKLKVHVSIGRDDGLVYVAVPGFGRRTAASSRKADVRVALVRLVGPVIVQQRELRGYRGEDDGDVLQRPTRRLKRRTVYLAEPERCFSCRRALPTRNAKRCVTPSGFPPRRSTCGVVRDDCPHSFKLGGSCYTKDLHNHRLIVTLASGLVVDAVCI
jgi:hypothetical protein